MVGKCSTLGPQTEDECWQHAKQNKLGKKRSVQLNLYAEQAASSWRKQEYSGCHGGTGEQGSVEWVQSFHFTRRDCTTVLIYLIPPNCVYKNMWRWLEFTWRQTVAAHRYAQDKTEGARGQREVPQASSLPREMSGMFSSGQMTIPQTLALGHGFFLN
jgi:hypothetical protein